jgi:hypothetical protein
MVMRDRRWSLLLKINRATVLVHLHSSSRSEESTGKIDGVFLVLVSSPHRPHDPVSNAVLDVRKTFRCESVINRKDSTYTTQTVQL